MLRNQVLSNQQTLAEAQITEDCTVNVQIVERDEQEAHGQASSATLEEENKTPWAPAE